MFGYRRCDGAANEELEFKARRIAMLSTQPITILREALQYLENQRVMAPGYRFLQDLVSRVVTGERRRITDMLGQAMTSAIEHQLAALLRAGEAMYLISELKHEPKTSTAKRCARKLRAGRFSNRCMSSLGPSSRALRFPTKA